MPAYGDLIPTGNGTEVRLHAPTRCGNGHPLRTNVNTSLVRWCPCVDGSHHRWECRTCGHVTYGPPHTLEDEPWQTGGDHTAYG